MFLRLRKVIYVLLSIGSIGGAFLALMGMLVALGVFASGIAGGSWSGIGIGLLMILACAAGATGPAWVLLTVVLLPAPSPRERRVLTALLAASILAAGGVSISMLTYDGAAPRDPSLPIVTMVVPMLVGCALVVELWLPVWRARRPRA
jgi:hypothetical protein